MTQHGLDKDIASDMSITAEIHTCDAHSRRTLQQRTGWMQALLAASYKGLKRSSEHLLYSQGAF